MLDPHGVNSENREIRSSVPLWVLEPNRLGSNPSSHLLPRARYSASLCPDFLACKMAIIIVLTS